MDTTCMVSHCTVGDPPLYGALYGAAPYRIPLYGDPLYGALLYGKTPLWPPPPPPGQQTKTCKNITFRILGNAIGNKPNNATLLNSYENSTLPLQPIENTSSRIDEHKILQGLRLTKGRCRIALFPKI